MDSVVTEIVIVLIVAIALAVYFRPAPDTPRHKPGGTVIARHNNGAYIVKAPNRRALEDADLCGPHVVPAKGQPGVFAVSPDWGTAWEAAGTPNDKTPITGTYMPKIKARSLRTMMEGDEHDYIQ